MFRHLLSPFKSIFTMTLLLTSSLLNSPAPSKHIFYSVSPLILGPFYGFGSLKYLGSSLHPPRFWTSYITPLLRPFLVTLVSPFFDGSLTPNLTFTSAFGHTFPVQLPAFVVVVTSPQFIPLVLQLVLYMPPTFVLISSIPFPSPSYLTTLSLNLLLTIILPSRLQRLLLNGLVALRRSPNR